MAVLWLKRIAVDFHARYSATRRHYQYILLNRGVRSAFGRVGFFHAPLNVGKMRAAALRLVGEHDFSAFRAAACQAKNPERHLFWAEVSAIGNFVIFDFCANGFFATHGAQYRRRTLYVVGVSIRRCGWGNYCPRVSTANQCHRRRRTGFILSGLTIRLVLPFLQPTDRWGIKAIFFQPHVSWTKTARRRIGKNNFAVFGLHYAAGVVAVRH